MDVSFGDDQGRRALRAHYYSPSYEDFTECFSLWCEEEPESSSSVFNIIAQHMESGMTVGRIYTSCGTGTYISMIEQMRRTSLPV